MSNAQKLAELKTEILEHLHEAASKTLQYDDLGGKVTLNVMTHFENDDETTNHLIGHEDNILNVLLSNDQLTSVILKSLKQMMIDEGEL